MNTIDYLNRVRALHDDCTDYRLAILLDVRHSTLVNYTKHEREMDEEIAYRVAEILGLPAMRVIADVKAARAESDGQTTMASFWRDAARAAGGVVKPLRVAGGGMAATAESGSKRRAVRGVAAGNGGPGRARTVDPGIMSPLL